MAVQIKCRNMKDFSLVGLKAVQIQIRLDSSTHWLLQNAISSVCIILRAPVNSEEAAYDLFKDLQQHSSFNTSANKMYTCDLRSDH